jgi:hypothetical protein
MATTNRQNSAGNVVVTISKKKWLTDDLFCVRGKSASKKFFYQCVVHYARDLFL